MAGITLTFKLRREPRVGLVYIGDGGTSTGTFHEGLNFAAVQRCPLVVIGEYNHWAYSTPPEKQFAVTDLAEKAKGYGIPTVTVDGNDVLAVYTATKHAAERARRGKGVHFIEVKTYRRKGHAEHDDQHYVPKDELERWAKENDPVDRYAKQLIENEWVEAGELTATDHRARDPCHGSAGRLHRPHCHLACDRGEPAAGAAHADAPRVSGQPPGSGHSRQRHTRVRGGHAGPRRTGDPGGAGGASGARRAGQGDGPLGALPAGARARPRRARAARDARARRRRRAVTWPRSPTSRRSARACGRRWSATSGSSSSARTSAPTAVRSRSLRGS